MRLDPAAKNVIERLEAAGHSAWVVGGCVRDSLLGLTPTDWDVCTTALPEETRAAFADCRLADTGAKHGTITVLLSSPVEVTTLRTEGVYEDRRRPSNVSFTGDVEADLARRDFTINAMAWSPKTGLCDPFGGRADLSAGVLRCVGEPEKRFTEDALRILRALRFMSKLGFAAEPETDAALRRCAPFLREISVERVFAELMGILRGEFVLAPLLNYPLVIGEAVPELLPMVGFDQRTPYHIYDVWEHTARAVAAAPAEGVVRLALLLHDMGKPAKFFIGPEGNGHFKGHGMEGQRLADETLRRLKCDSETRELVTLLVRLHDDTLPKTEAGMRRLLSRLGPKTVKLLFEVKRADAGQRAPSSAEGRMAALEAGQALAEQVLSKKPCLTLSELAIGGRELMAAGVPQGPELGKLLSALLDEVLEGTLENRPETLLRRAEELLRR